MSAAGRRFRDEPPARQRAPSEKTRIASAWRAHDSRRDILIGGLGKDTIIGDDPWGPNEPGSNDVVYADWGDSIIGVETVYLPVIKFPRW